MSLLNSPLVRIVDDDPSLRKSLEFMLKCEGFDVKTYEAAECFLKEDTPSRLGCLILDVKMPGLSGIELQHEMNRRSITIPIIFLTAHGEIDMAVQSMRDGAFDFLQKPVDPSKLLPAVTKAIIKSKSHQIGASDLGVELHKKALLTQREEQVLRHVSQGFLNREIASKLGLSIRTIEVQRASGKKKIGLSTPAELSIFFERVDLALSKGSL